MNHQDAYRTGKVLLLLKRHDVGIGDVARELGVSRSTAWRVLQLMWKHGKAVRYAWTSITGQKRVRYADVEEFRSNYNVGDVAGVEFMFRQQMLPFSQVEIDRMEQ